MGYLVFSHTRMGGSGFCTNIGGRSQSTGKIVQLRLRISPNEPLKYSHFGSRAADFRTKLLPGSSLAVEHFFKASPPRISHPEDWVINPNEVSILEDEDFTALLHEYAEEMAFDNVHDLFPGMLNGNGKWYRPAELANDRSVGYVRASGVSFFFDSFNGQNPKLRGTVTDFAGNEFSAPVVGVDLLGGHDLFGESLVRLSLAGSFASDCWKGTAHPERCFLMLSHVIKR